MNYKKNTMPNKGVMDNSDLKISKLADTPLDSFILSLRNADDINDLKATTLHILQKNLSNVILDKMDDAKFSIILFCILDELSKDKQFVSYLKEKSFLALMDSKKTTDSSELMLASIMILIINADLDFMHQNIKLIKEHVLKSLIGKGSTKSKLKSSLDGFSEEQVLKALGNPVLNQIKLPATLVEFAKEKVQGLI